jgi:hypothetical protein
MKTKTHGSIENSHKQKICEYALVESKLKKHYARLKLLTNEVANTSLTVFEQLELDDKIFNLKQEIEDLKEDDSFKYLLKVSDVLKRYNDETNDVFTKNDMSVKTQMNHFIETKTGNQRGQLYQQYNDILQNNSVLPMDSAKNTPVSKTVHSRCNECEGVMTIAVNETHLLCSNCGVYEPYFEPSAAGLTYEQEIHTETNIHFAYKRINHLRELLSQLQAKETSDIPDDVLDKVRAEFRKARIQNTSEITQNRVKSYLKKLSLNKYYEHTRQITNILNGKPPPVISNALYENFINMFMEIQEPFEKVCPKNRKNFFSYNYILYKFCELLGELESQTLFPLLKSREKLYQQDCIWKDICAILGWTFYKSV